MRTAILMLTHDFYEYTKAAMGSLLFNTRHPYHLFIVDDASTDNTKHLKDSHGVTVLRHTEPRGVSAGWNTGLRQILSEDWEVVIITNNDVLFGPLWLKHLLLGLEKGYVFCGPVSNRPGGSGPQTTRQLVSTYLTGYEESDHPIDIAYTSFKLQQSLQYIEAINLNGFVFGGFTEAFRQNALASDKVFNTRQRDLGSEDSFFFKYADAHSGHSSVVCSGSFVYHYKGITARHIYGTRGYGNLTISDGKLFGRLVP